MSFSIVIPLYNKEKHIKKAINSVLNQTYNDFELIIVDDGSTDSSFDIANDFSDTRIKVYRKSNGGVSSARNFGIKRSNNKYIGLLDADDTWDPSFLAAIYSLIKKYPTAGAYATSYNFIQNKKITPASLNISLDKGKSSIVDYFKGTLYKPLISASSVVISKDVFKSIGLFRLDINKGEDLEMWCRIALKYEIAFLNNELANYYLDADNRSNKTEVNYSKSFMRCVEDILEQQRKIGNSSFFFEEYMIGRIMHKVRYLINNNRKKEARKLLLKYKRTQYYKKQWRKNYILSFGPIYYLYKKIYRN